MTAGCGVCLYLWRGLFCIPCPCQVVDLYRESGAQPVKERKRKQNDTGDLPVFFYAFVRREMSVIKGRKTRPQISDPFQSSSFHFPKQQCWACLIRSCAFFGGVTRKEVVLLLLLWGKERAERQSVFFTFKATHTSNQPLLSINGQKQCCDLETERKGFRIVI